MFRDGREGYLPQKICAFVRDELCAAFERHGVVVVVVIAVVIDLLPSFLKGGFSPLAFSVSWGLLLLAMRFEEGSKIYVLVEKSMWSCERRRHGFGLQNLGAI